MLDIEALFNDVTEKQLDEILRLGEGLQIEFKESVPSLLDLAKELSAFANTAGGVLVIGARERKPQIVYSGPDPRVDQLFDGVAERLRPAPPRQMHRVNYRGALVPVIVVKSHPNELVVSDAGAFIRVGDKTETMPGDKVRKRLSQQPPQVREERGADEISRLTAAFDEFRGKFDASQSWGGQWKNLLVGCAGSTLSTIVVWLFGIVIGALLLYFFNINWGGGK